MPLNITRIFQKKDTFSLFEELDRPRQSQTFLIALIRELFNATRNRKSQNRKSQIRRREKLEHEIRERMEEKRREQMLKIRETLISRKPEWRALRSAARYAVWIYDLKYLSTYIIILATNVAKKKTRHEHETDLDIRTCLRRDEAREQAERHRLQMELMLDRVTQIPTLFERHSQVLWSFDKLTSCVILELYGENITKFFI